MALLPFADGEPRRRMRSAPASIVPLRGRMRLVDVVRALDAAGVEAVDVQRREATLDDVFLTLTGHSAGTERAAELAEVAA